MPTRFLLLAATLLVAAPLGAKPASKTRPKPVATEIYVGQVMGDVQGITVNGWLHTQGSLYLARPTAGQSAGDAYDCCISVFQKGKRYIVARTEAVTRNPDGGVTSQRVLKIFRITVLPGEAETMCEGTSRWLALSLKNEKTGAVRSVAVDNKGEMSLFQWKDTGGLCGFDG